MNVLVYDQISIELIKSKAKFLLVSTITSHPLCTYKLIKLHEVISINL